MEKNKILTIPNILSISRLLLIPAFVWLYLESGDNRNFRLYATGLIILSGLTDLVDGYIARRLNQITELGKMLDPIADKCTQLVVAIMLTIAHPQIIVLVIAILIKDSLMVIGGAMMLRKGIVRAAEFWGKIFTAVFYVSVAAIIPFGYDIGDTGIWYIIIINLLIMLAALISYVPGFIKAVFGNDNTNTGTGTGVTNEDDMRPL